MCVLLLAVWLFLAADSADSALFQTGEGCGVTGPRNSRHAYTYLVRIDMMGKGAGKAYIANVQQR